MAFVTSITNDDGRHDLFVAVGARHRLLGRQVAIKFLTQSGDVVARERFVREARIIAALRSENVVRVIDVGAARVGDEDLPYIVMERLEGETVSAYQRRKG